MAPLNILMIGFFSSLNVQMSRLLCDKREENHGYCETVAMKTCLFAFPMLQIYGTFRCMKNWDIVCRPININFLAIKVCIKIMITSYIEEFLLLLVEFTIF